MKNSFNIILFLAVISLFSACEENAIDDLAGTYPPPAPYTLGKVLLQNVQKNERSRTITLQLATDGLTTPNAGAGNYLAIDFVGNRLNSFLAPGVYTPAANSSAPSIGNYITGDNTCWYTVANGAVSSKLKVTNGTFFVTRTNDSRYTISGTLLLEDKSMVKVSYDDEIVFEADPPAFTYTVEVNKPYAWTADGTTYIPVPGSQLNKITVSSDGQNIAYFEIVTTENPASLSGVYPVSGEIRDANGAVVQGMYMDLSVYVPGLIIEGGSYLLDGDAKQYIGSGTLTIADNGGVLTFTSSDLAVAVLGVPVEGIKTVNYADATKEGGSSGGGTHTNLFSASALDLSLFGLSGFTVTLKVATSDLTVNVEQGPMGATYTYAGSGQYISFDFSRDAGTLPAGTYNVVDNTTAQVGDCLAGYPSLFGAGFMGTFVGNVVNGAATEEAVTGGTITVTDGGFSFSLTTASGTIEGSYAGAITFQ
jgi:hypothetical protein